MKIIAGVDEVGRGPLAGPVYAAAVVLPKNHTLIGLEDSKKISKKKRELLFLDIRGMISRCSSNGMFSAFFFNTLHSFDDNPISSKVFIE